MERDSLLKLDLSRVETPAFIVFEDALVSNLEKLSRVRKATGAKILLALKGFAMFSMFPLMKKYLQGTCASSIHEAHLGKEEFRGKFIPMPRP